jgi:hypothetical protein
MMRRKFGFLSLLSLVLLASCGPSVRLYSDRDHETSFEQYETYNFIDFSDGNKRTISGMELERIRVAFARELESHGLSFSEENPDVSVKIIVYHREASRGIGYSGIYHHMERALSIDMYDNHSMKHVWHCAAVEELQPDPERRAEELPLVVARMFERYPVRLPAIP